eukprot:2143999-Rhodomonas_salina.1
MVGRTRLRQPSPPVRCPPAGSSPAELKQSEPTGRMVWSMEMPTGRMGQLQRTDAVEWDDGQPAWKRRGAGIDRVGAGAQVERAEQRGQGG